MNDIIKNSDTLFVFVHDTILVSEELIVRLCILRLTTQGWNIAKRQAFGDVTEEPETVVSIAEYRNLLNDFTSTDAQVVRRLQYLEALCENIIRSEIQNYEQSQKNINC